MKATRDEQTFTLASEGGGSGWFARARVMGGSGSYRIGGEAGLAGGGMGGFGAVPGLGRVAHRLLRLLLAGRIPGERRVDQRGVDAGLVHLGQDLVRGEGRDLAVLAAAGAGGPDMDLGVDDLHGISSARILRRFAPMW